MFYKDNNAARPMFKKNQTALPNKKVVHPVVERNFIARLYIKNDPFKCKISPCVEIRSNIFSHLSHLKLVHWPCLLVGLKVFINGIGITTLRVWYVFGSIGGPTVWSSWRRTGCRGTPCEFPSCSYSFDLVFEPSSLIISDLSISWHRPLEAWPPLLTLILWFPFRNDMLSL